MHTLYCPHSSTSSKNNDHCLIVSILFTFCKIIHNHVNVTLPDEIQTSTRAMRGNHQKFVQLSPRINLVSTLMSSRPHKLSNIFKMTLANHIVLYSCIWGLQLCIILIGASPHRWQVQCGLGDVCLYVYVHQCQYPMRILQKDMWYRP